MEEGAKTIPKILYCNFTRNIVEIAKVLSFS
jgi:hypothetical protein